MQTPKTRSSSSEVPQKISPRIARQLRPAALETDSSSSSSQPNKIRSPKVTERRSPRSPAPERKRPSRISELESQVSQLQEDLKKVRDQLTFSESCEKQAQQDAQDSKEQLLALSAKLEDTQKQLQELSATEESHLTQLQKNSEERHKTCQSELEVARNQLSGDSVALASALNEIQKLKTQLELVANAEDAQIQQAESAKAELENLKQKLAETLSLVENMKSQLRDCKESEAKAQALVHETLSQLESAKSTVEFLRADTAKAAKSYNSVALELEQSRARLKSLEELVSKLKADLTSNRCSHYEIVGNESNGHNFEKEPEKLEGEERNQTEAEIYSLKTEIGRLRSTLENAETKYHEEQIRSTVQIRNAHEMVEQIKSEASQRESEIMDELKKKRADIEDLKANLMDKETELQGIVEENEGLNLKLEKSLSSQRERELKKQVKRLDECVAGLRADLMDKETTLQSISEENELLKMEITKRFKDGGILGEEVTAEVEAAKAAEREAVAKLGMVVEEADRSNRKAVRVVEQLEAAKAANSEMEAELRRLKVQSDQWRKAAEAAAAMLSAGNNGKLTERTLSLDNNSYNPFTGRCSPYAEDTDDDFQRKKNGNVLKKFGVLWKKPQK